MNFDETVNKILNEAYFSSPYEKATGIKRQVNIQGEEYDEPSAEFNYDEIDFNDDDALSPEQEFEKFQDEGEQFVQRIQGLSALQGEKLRTQFGLHDITAQALEKWMDSGAPEGKRGVDLLIDAFLSATSGVRLTGDATMTYELQKVAYALAYVTGLKNEKLISHEQALCKKIAAQQGMDAEEVFEKRWAFHFELDPSTGHPAKLSREEKASGVKTKRQGKPLMSGERFRKILEGGQLKTKKGMDVQKLNKDQGMGDQEAATDKKSQWMANRDASRKGQPLPFPGLDVAV